MSNLLNYFPPSNLPNLTNVIQQELTTYGYYELPGNCTADYITLLPGMKLNGRGYNLYCSSNFNPTHSTSQAFMQLKAAPGEYDTTIVKNINIFNTINSYNFTGSGIGIDVQCPSFILENILIGDNNLAGTTTINTSASTSTNRFYTDFYDFDICLNISSQATTNLKAVLKNIYLWNYRLCGIVATGNIQDVLFDNITAQGSIAGINGYLQYPMRHFYCNMSRYKYINSHVFGDSNYGCEFAGRDFEVAHNQFEAAAIGAVLLTGDNGWIHDNTIGFNIFGSPGYQHGTCACLVIGQPYYNPYRFIFGPQNGNNGFAQSCSGDIMGHVSPIGPSFCRVEQNYACYPGRSPFSTNASGLSNSYGYSLPGGYIRVLQPGNHNYISLTIPYYPPSGTVSLPQAYSLNSQTYCPSGSTNTLVGTGSGSYYITNPGIFNSWMDFTWNNFTNGYGNYVQLLNSNTIGHPIVTITPSVSG